MASSHPSSLGFVGTQDLVAYSATSRVGKTLVEAWLQLWALGANETVEWNGMSRRTRWTIDGQTMRFYDGPDSIDASGKWYKEI